MSDHTILYYTANRLSDPLATNVRNHLLEVTEGRIRIISISQKPMDFGDNIYVPGLEPCIYNIYKQILIGAREVKTKYIICCEDDTLYTKEHLEHIPDNSFDYNINKWYVRNGIYFHRNRQNMAMCVAPTDMMVETLEARFNKYPERVESEIGWGEPGRYERYLGLPQVRHKVFSTSIPTLGFSHEPGVGGVRHICTTDEKSFELPFWGRSEDVWKRMVG